MTQGASELYSLSDVARLVSELHFMRLLTVDSVAVESFLEIPQRQVDGLGDRHGLHCETLKLLLEAIKETSEANAGGSLGDNVVALDSSPHTTESKEVEYTYILYKQDDATEYIYSDELGREVKQDEGNDDEDEDEVKQEEEEAVVVSDLIYEELYPYKEIIPKRELPGMFPNIEDFTGGFTLLGKGNFGITFRSMLKGVPVVLKVSLEKGEKANKADYHEWSVNERLKPHPNVLQIVGLCPSFNHPACPDIGTTAIISPLQENGTLASFLQRIECDRSSEWEMANLAFGMIRGIASLHEQGVIHRDIALRNYLVDKDGRVVLCDFGLTQFLPEGKDQLDNLDKGESLPIRWLAPENLGGIFTKKSDMWMYGQTLLELVTGGIPWPEHSTKSLVKAMISKELELPSLAVLPPIIAEIIRDCCEVEPSRRPSAAEVSERLAKWQFQEHDTHREDNGDTELHTHARKGSDLFFRFKSRAPGAFPTRMVKRQRVPPGRGTMINATNDFGETPLVVAKDKDTMMHILWYRNIPLSNTQPSADFRYTYNVDVAYAVFKFVESDNFNSLRLLSQFQLKHFLSDFDKPEYRGRTPIHAVAHSGSLQMLKLLLSFKVFDVTKTDIDGQSALHVAASHGYHKIISMLLSHVEATSEDAAQSHAVDNQLVPHQAAIDVNMQDKKGKTALHLAAVHGTVEAIQTLVGRDEMKLDITDDHNRTPLVDMLATLSSDKLASTSASVQKAKLLTESGSSVISKDSQGYTALHHAAERGLLEVFTLLLSRPEADVNIQTSHGLTALHLAAQGGHAGVTEILLHRQDIMLNTCDRWKNTALHFAAEHGNEKVVQSLLACPTLAINAQNKRSESAVHIASAQGYTNVVKILLQRPDTRADLCDSEDRTALHLAAKRGHSATVELLPLVLL